MEKKLYDNTKTYTPIEYARKIGISPQSLNYRIRNNKVKTVEINGATLIYNDEND